MTHIIDFTSVQAAQQAWQTPTLATGWGSWDTESLPTTTTAQYAYPRYYKDSLGIVHLAGLAKNSSGATATRTASGLVFTLPAGYRPGHALRIIIMTSYTGTPQDFGQEIDIDVDGSVKLIGVTSVPSGQWISLNNIHFRADQ